jgi:membrane-bound lytic murein transglycosylase D
MNRINRAIPAIVMLLPACATRAPVAVPLPEPLRPPVDVAQPGPADIPPIELVLDVPVHLPDAPVPLAGFPTGVYANDFEIPIQYHVRVGDFLELFTGRFRNDFSIWLSRRGRFETMIVDELRARDLPIELLHLPLVESGYSTSALSRASALGLWQFIAGTARIEGLEVSSWVDERRNPERATAAALQHLEKLHSQYGSWYLALSAYNAGPGRVNRALDRRGIGTPTDESSFWAIRDLLPRETRDYVPLFIAASVISRYPALFGFDGVEPQLPDLYDVVTVPDATDLVVIAEAAGTTEVEIRRLNPQYIRGVTPPDRSAPIRLPEGLASAFEVAYSAIPPEKRIRVREHIVRRGETLSAIAARYGTSVRVIQDANGIRRPDRLQIGQRLRIPVAQTRPSS